MQFILIIMAAIWASGAAIALLLARVAGMQAPEPDEATSEVSDSRGLDSVQ